MCVCRNLFCDEEISRLRTSLEAPGSKLMKNSYSISDGDGGFVKMVLWNHPGRDYSGMMGRCERIVDTASEVCVRSSFFCLSSQPFIFDYLLSSHCFIDNAISLQVLLVSTGT